MLYYKMLARHSTPSILAGLVHIVRRGTVMNRWLFFLLFASLAVPIPSNELDWSPVGPPGGAIVQILPDRDHPGLWYLWEGQYSRLYRSTDNGHTWHYNGIKGLRKLLVHSASSEVFIVRYGRDGKNELLSSTDFGRTFRFRSGNAPENIFDHPSDPKILWGSGVSNYYNLSISYDGGAHWKGFTNLPFKLGKTYSIDGTELVAEYYYLESVLASPLDSKTIYVSTSVEFPYGCSSEILDLELVSRNFGKTWAFAEYPAGRYIYDKAFPDRAFFVNNVETRILTGSGWKRLISRPFYEIVSVPGRPETLYGLYFGKEWISRDGGTNWQRIRIGPGGKARVLQARNFPEGSLLAGTYGAGAYVIDNNRNWTPTNGLPQTAVSDVSTAPGSKIIFAVVSAGDSFLYRSVDSGQTWRNITDHLPDFSNYEYGDPKIIVNQKNGRHVFAIVSDRVLVSFDAGEKWTYLPQKPLNRVFFDPDFKTVYFSKPSYNHLYKSTDGGRTLLELPAEFGSSKTTIHDLKVDPFNGYLFAATSRGLFVSKDGGRTTQQIATDLSPECLHCLSFDQVLTLPLRGQYIVSADGSFYKSVNQGVTWRKLSEGTGRLYVADNRGQHLYQITGRLLESRNGGVTWDPISASIHPLLASGDYSAIRDLTDPRYRPLFVATTAGIFRAGS